MSVTSYDVLRDRTSDNLKAQVTAALGNGWQPFGYPFVSDEDFVCQAMIKGVQDSNNLASASAAVANGDTIAVKNSAGADSHNATAEVSANTLNDVKFPATVAMVDNTDTVVVHNSAGSVIAGTHVAEVALGVLSDVKLASTVAGVTNGMALTGVAPSGSYTNTVTFTVTAGVISAIVLS